MALTKEELAKKTDEFVSKYNGKTKGYPTDNDFGGECLSIVKIYMKEIFGFNPPPSGSNSAYGYWSNFPSPLSDYFERIPISASEKPFKGCVPIWTTAVGAGFGHIDIFLEGDNSGWTGFDQNWGGRQAHKQTHDYSNIVGYLKPKLTSSNRPIITDILLALKGQTTEDEIIAWEQRFENPKRMIEIILEGDGGAYQLWIKPHVDKALETGCADKVKEAVAATIAERDTIWKEQLDAANLRINALVEQTAEKLDWRTLMSIAWKKWWQQKKG